MKVEWRREPGSRAVLEVEVPVEDVQREVRASAARLARQVRVPGFRPGKAPRAVLERYVGRDELYSEALDALVSSAYRQALAEVGVVPVGRPEFDVPALDETQPLRFVARVDVVPDVDPGPYDRIRIPFEEPTVTDADVDAAIEELRRRRGRLVSVHGTAARGDFVLIRPTVVEGSDRFQVGRDVLVEVGAGVFPPEVEQALEGAAAGEERTAQFGEGGRLVATVVDVKRRELPALDDAFAKTVADVATVEELRARLRERLAADAAARAREAYEEKVITGVLDGASVDLPASLIDHEIEHLVADLEESLQRRGYTLTGYLEGAGKDQAALRDELRPRAERRLRLRLVLDEITRREGLVPTKEEIAAEEEKVAADLKQDPARVREWLDREGRREAMMAVLRRRKTVEMLVARAQGVGSGGTP
ncbi:MAG: trigger factor [Armatimonadota bacterium]|nr:trigger factor [Armatimonadota bacterium]MDR7519348.1 trigger factor [Armatimonadota bacterium]MDR7548394.1 trigger factor [Armatimonadota bacterium]